MRLTGCRLNMKISLAAALFHPKCYGILREWESFTHHCVHWILLLSMFIFCCWFRSERWHIFDDCIMNRSVDTMDDIMNRHRKATISMNWNWNRQLKRNDIYTIQTHAHTSNAESMGNSGCVNEQEHNFQIITV